MDSSVVPITLIVVLLISAIAFVAVSSRGGGSSRRLRGADAAGVRGRVRPRGRRRRTPLATPRRAGGPDAGGHRADRAPAATGRSSAEQAVVPSATASPTMPIHTQGPIHTQSEPPREPPTTALTRSGTTGLGEPAGARAPGPTTDGAPASYLGPHPPYPGDTPGRDTEILTTTTQTSLPGSGGTGLPDNGQRRSARESDATGWTPPPLGPPPAVIPDPERSRPSSTPAEPTGTRGYDDMTGRIPPDQTIPPIPATGEPLVADEPDVSTSPALRLAAAGRTRRGKRGGPNEDAFVVVDGLLAVADGVGGEAAGQIASTLAVTTVASFRPQYAADPRQGLRGALERANRTVREKPREEPSWHGMACTLDVVVLGRQRDTGETLFVAHVGDSSVWLQPGRGRPRRLTTPHAIKNGPLLNAIGLNEEVELDLLEEAVQAGDRVILASDGITKVMTPDQLDGLMMELGTMSPEGAADALVEAAMLAGARDDTTIVVADLVPDTASR